MVGVDFLVKLLGYLVRFKILHLSARGAASGNSKAMLGSIVDSRMLSNAGKAPGTFVSAMKIFETPFPAHWAAATAVTSPSSSPSTTTSTTTTSAAAAASSAMSVAMPVKVASVAALALRTLEQVASDCGYLARYVFQSWSVERLTLEYKRWKSLSLTCLLAVEVAFLAVFLQQQHLRRRRQRRQQQQQQTGKEHREADEVTTASASAAAAVPYKYRFQTIAAGVAISPLEAINSAIVAVRCLCDMYIYYRWIPSWQPPDVWQFSAGMVSAVLGIWLVLEETVVQVAKSAAQRTVGSSVGDVTSVAGSVVGSVPRRA